MHTTLVAPVSNRTRRKMESEKSSGRSYGWLSAVIVAGLLISMIGSAWLNREPSNPNDNLAFAPGTAEPLDAQAPWTQPISYAECPRDEVVRVDRENNPSGTRYALEDYEGLTSDRDYEIVGPADPNDANAVVTSIRQSYACGVRSESIQAWSARFEWETRTTAGRESLARIEGERTEASMNVSSWLETELGLTPLGMVVEQDPSELVLDGTEALITQGLYNPAHTVEFADGRIGIIPSGVYFTSLPAELSEESMPGFAPHMSIFVYQDGKWLLDENLQVCIGDCSATPAASPMGMDGDVPGERWAENLLATPEG